MLLLVVIVSVWLVRPFGVIADYVRYVRASASFSLPRLGRRALGAIGAAYDEMRDALAGRNYVADYVQTFTHEIKSPLSAIRGAAELLQEPMADADRARFLANIARETQRIQEIVDRMMELTALESRRASTAPRRSRCARSPARSRPARRRRRGARHRRRAACRATPMRWSKAMPSCCGARSATCSTTPSTFRRRAAGSRSRSAAHARSATSPCATTARASPTTPRTRCSRSSIRSRGRTAKKSTGLGLAFVKEIADLHRGRASWRTAGGGALATLSLPRSER